MEYKMALELHYVSRNNYLFRAQTIYFLYVKSG